MPIPCPHCIADSVVDDLCRPGTVECRRCGRSFAACGKSSPQWRLNFRPGRRFPSPPRRFVFWFEKRASAQNADSIDQRGDGPHFLHALWQRLAPGPIPLMAAVWRADLFLVLLAVAVLAALANLTH
jgi:hypothetical protein